MTEGVELQHAAHEVVLANRLQRSAKTVVLITDDLSYQLIAVVEGAVEIEQDCFNGHAQAYYDRRANRSAEDGV